MTSLRKQEPKASEPPVCATKTDALLEAKTFAAQRGCPPESLPQACTAHRIFCVVIDGQPMYPAFYVDPQFDQAQLARVTKLLEGLPGGSKWQFFTNPKGSLGSVTPLESLLAGHYAKVRNAALAFRER